MPDLTATLEAIGTELAGLLSDDTPAIVEMKFAEFVDYCNQQIGLAKNDSNPAPRINALVEVVNLAKAYTWEDGSTMSVPVFSGPESVQAQSAYAERIADHPGLSLPTAPGQQAVPGGGQGGAFEAPSGPSGPSGNTVSPAASYMPPTFPQSEPAAGAQGFMAKAAQVLAKAENGDALLGELKALLDAEAQPGDGNDLKDEVKKDDGWPLDLATESFLEDKPAVRNEDDFGKDPGGLGRGKIIRD